MKDVFVVSDNIISPVGNTAAENFHALLNNQSALKNIFCQLCQLFHFMPRCWIENL